MINKKEHWTRSLYFKLAVYFVGVLLEFITKLNAMVFVVTSHSYMDYEEEMVMKACTIIICQGLQFALSF